jgi:hypothetical protein
MKMSAKQVIKNAGFTTKRVERDSKGGFGGNCNHSIVLVNKVGQKLHFEGNVYYPIGRFDSFASLISSGDINAECFTFA